jgi:hypothetical protein
MHLRSNRRPDPLTDAAKAPIRRVEHSIKRLAAMDLIYGWGGARVGGPSPHIAAPAGKGLAWTDCSGLGLYEIAVVGFRLENPIGNTTSLLTEPRLAKGRGRWLTFLIKEIPGQPDESHMLIEVRGRHAECGGFDNPSAGGGPSWFKPSAARLEEFSHHLHIPGL